jgi:hypothetical protein
VFGPKAEEAVVNAARKIKWKGEVPVIVGLYSACAEEEE